MKINLTKKQYKNLLYALEAGSSVYGILGDMVSEEDYKQRSNQIQELKEYFWSFAQEFGLEELTDKYEDKTIPNEELEEEFQRDMDEYDNETFWHELTTRLGKRDFERTTTEAEMEEIRQNYGMYPDRIDDLYQKWEEEFEKNGLERLNIQK